MRSLAFLTSFLMAFLLFAVQPMATKMVLPTLGGTPAVWNTVMFTFQLLLLLGYLYAHMLMRCLPTRAQLLVHTALILATMLFLPLSVTLATSDAMIHHPIAYLIKAFLLQLGLPFFCLAATAPLLQSWVSRAPHALSKNPYVLYSASNLGSFAGLLGYVIVVEPLLALNQQSYAWSGLYLAGTALLLFTGMRLNPADKAPALPAAAKPLRWRDRLTWIGLAFLPSSLSLGVTTYITTDIASIPLLWVIPLSIYLLSFVDAFRTRPVLVAACQRVAPIAGVATLMLYGFGGEGSITSFLLHLLSFAILAFAIHGWLAARQPTTTYLTQFYVCLSVGGALGGVLNGLVAPLVFDSAMEYPLVLIAASLTCFILLQRRESSAVKTTTHLRMCAEMLLMVVAVTGILYLILARNMHPIELDYQKLVRISALAALLSLAVYRTYIRAFYACISVCVIVTVSLSQSVAGNSLFKDRNFFGVMRVYENPHTNARYIAHDTTTHGVQSLDPKWKMTPMAYYSPLRNIFMQLPPAHKHPFAIVGLGAGALKCLAVKNQQVDIYEINPMTKDIAENRTFFTYVSDCPGNSQILLGDGRIRMAEQAQGKYGVIIMDAFSSDAIPNHLLTQEAMATYLDKLTPDGVLMFHTTNRHIDLWPLLAAQAKAMNLHAYGKRYPAATENPLIFEAHWVVLAKSPQTLKPLISTGGWQELQDEGTRPWTDQYINLLPYLKIFR